MAREDLAVVHYLAQTTDGRSRENFDFDGIAGQGVKRRGDSLHLALLSTVHDLIVIWVTTES